MSSAIRKGVLISILMLAASAFAYDQLVIKSCPSRIQAELMDLVNDTSHTYSEAEILGLVDRPSQTIFETKQKKIIKYTWRGLSTNSYDLFVVFRKFRGAMLISDVSLQEPSALKPFIDPSQVGGSTMIE